MPWRSRRTPYRVFVSEIMLQQTGISRVLEPYRRFLRAFPSFRALAAAPASAVLSCWQGLGYNRRALALLQSARIVADRYGGRLPRTVDELRGLPGVGPATAGAILVYAFGLPVPFIETNVRRVFLHFYFPGAEAVPDEQIMPLVEKTLDRREPRDWFYALMDYGTFLGRGSDNANRRSAVYKRQAPFRGPVGRCGGRWLLTL
jgi:A/G-specific adenine glycosylase